ncbi:signal peptidase I [Nocardioides sp.]|uniref:signal peptidase I n=1 Tax=Nocardioides sp. TaxID=35761 RepID=UPI002B26BB58|nr:signal peptidase I [Nocardioides sp.]
MNDDQHPTGTDDEVAATSPDGPEGLVDSDAAAPAEPEVDDVRRGLPLWQESLLLVGAAVVLAVVLKVLFVQAFYIPSASMEPALVENDRILVQKPSYWFGGEPSRGDVVVFEDPGGWLGADEEVEVTGVRSLLATVGLYPDGGHLVKRVIGVAGDTITCCDDEGRLLLNGEPLDEGDYVAERPEGIQCDGPMISTCNWSAGPVPEGTVFVMGDNRSDSADSSYHVCLVGETDCTDNPYIDTDLVVGKVFSVVWPLSNFGLVSGEDSLSDLPDAD